MEQQTHPSYRKAFTTSTPNCVLASSFPLELREQNQWVCYRLVGHNGQTKPTKIPCQPHAPAHPASVNKPHTWGTFEQARTAWTSQPNLHGIGFVFTPDDPFCGIDLDRCRDPHTGNLKPWAKEIVSDLNSYTEVSPSGTGIHIIVEGKLPKGRNRIDNIEIYDCNRYFCMTGQALPGTPTTIKPRQAKLDMVVQKIFAQLDSPPLHPMHALSSSHTLSDDEVIAKACAASNGQAFRNLWEGRWTAYPSQSEADQALCNYLAFWTNGHPTQMDRLFRQSACYRKKWDAQRGESTYGQRTITQAIATTPDRYSKPLAASSATIPPPAQQPWPILQSDALYGVVGKVIQTIAPHTEADRVNLLAHLLAEFSAIIGPEATTDIEGHPTPLLVWPVIVGDSSKARKGTGATQIRKLLETAAPEWSRGHYRGSLSSGEGLVYAVRDRQVKTVEGEGRTIEEIIDEGVTDKRLYLVQSEFASVLKMINRQGNSLSDIVREAWDGRDLCPMTKNSRIKATAPHIVIAGHITQADLVRYLTETDIANGFANRFLWLMVRRSQELPLGSSIDEDAYAELVHELRQAIQYRRGQMRPTRLDDEAIDIWKLVYHDLSKGKEGLVGSLLARGEAYVRRIAALYALLDCQMVITGHHLRAALAVWDYAEQSVQYLFGTTSGNPIEDAILTAISIAPDGMTDTQISHLFQRNVSAALLETAKAALSGKGRISVSEVQTGGRPCRKWHMTKE